MTDLLVVPAFAFGFLTKYHLGYVRDGGVRMFNVRVVVVLQSRFLLLALELRVNTSFQFDWGQSGQRLTIAKNQACERG